MITGDIKNRIDSIWDTYWVGGITNPMSVLEQMTYLFFMKMLDDAQIKKEAEANILGVKVPNPTFKEGMWHNPDTDADVPYNNLRWHVFKNMEAAAMINTIRNDIEAIEHQKELIKQSIKEVETLFNSRMDYYFS